MEELVHAGNNTGTDTGNATVTDPATDRATPLADPRFRFRLGIITVAAFALRMAVTLVTRGFDKAAGTDGDGFYYSTITDNLAKGHWFINPFTGAPTADHPPLTILVLAPATWLFNSTFAQRVTMMLVGTATVAVIGLIGRRIGGDRVGLVAALIALANPNLWINDSLTMSESLAALFVALLVWCGLVLVERPTLKHAVVTGLTLGLTLLARAELGWFLVLMVVPILASAGSITWPQRARLLAVTTVCAGVMVAPWIAWNSTRFEQPVWLSNNSGGALAGSNCDATYFGDIIGGWSLECAVAHERPGSDASENSARGVRTAVTYVRDHLGRLPLVILAREGRVFGFFEPQTAIDANAREGRPRSASWAAMITFWLLVAPSVIGARARFRRGPRAGMWPFFACLVCPIITAALFYGIPRFRIPLDVAMCLLAAVPIAALWDRRQDVMSLRLNHQ